jgi:hypothetical protein
MKKSSLYIAIIAILFTGAYVYAQSENVPAPDSSVDVSIVDPVVSVPLDPSVATAVQALVASTSLPVTEATQSYLSHKDNKIILDRLDHMVLLLQDIDKKIK